MFEKLKEIIVNQSQWLQKPLLIPYDYEEHEFYKVLLDECYDWLGGDDLLVQFSFCAKNGKITDLEIIHRGYDTEGNSDTFDYTAKCILRLCEDAPHYFENENVDTGEIEMLELAHPSKEIDEALLELEILLQQLYPLINKVFGPILEAEDDDFIVCIDF